MGSLLGSHLCKDPLTIKNHGCLLLAISQHSSSVKSCIYSYFAGPGGDVKPICANKASYFLEN